MSDLIHTLQLVSYMEHWIVILAAFAMGLYAGTLATLIVVGWFTRDRG